MKRPLLLVGLVFLLYISLSAVCSAGEKQHKLDSRSGLDAYLQGDYATGDWGGARGTLKEAGFEPFLIYTNNPAGNPVGGKHPGHATYVDDIWFGFNLDLEKLIGWRGGRFTVSGVNRDGSSLTDRYIGGVFQAQQVFGGQTIFLYQFFLEQEFFEKKIALKLGRFAAGDDFNTSTTYELYMNGGINPGVENVVLDTQFTSDPFSTWAARLNLKPTEESYVKFGVFQTSQELLNPDRHGVDWSFHEGDGVLLAMEVGWTPEFMKVRALDQSSADTSAKDTPKMQGMPGHYWIGATYSPWKGYPEFRTGRKVGNSYGFYINADQMVYREKPGSNQGLILWATSAYYPQEDISIIPFQINGGLVYKGLFPTLDKDEAIFGILYGRYSRDFAAAQKLRHRGDPRYEMVLEAGYRFHLTKFVYIQPDVQYHIRPGGTDDIPDALVVGAQMGVTF